MGWFKGRKAADGAGKRTWFMRVLALIFLAAVMGAGALLCAVLAKRAAVYSYDTSESYTYDFDGTQAIISKIALVNGNSARLPPVGGGNHTAFLEVEVDTTFIGKHIDPSIEVRAGAQVAVQYFERGAKGTRYLNVSPFIGTNSTDIVLQGNHVGLVGEEVELVRFTTEIPDEPTVFVVAPHPDDAEIAAYGFYSDIKDTYIVTFTAGEAGTCSYDQLFDDEVAHYLKKGELRTWNSITVPMLCGIPPERAVNLGFFDGTLKEMFADKNTDVCGENTKISDIDTFRKQNLSSLALKLDGSANWNSLVGNLARLLKETDPDIIITAHPELDPQEDHRFSSIALFEAIKMAGLRDGDLYFYANHFKYGSLYPYGPRGSAVSLPPDFSDHIYFSSIYSHPLTPESQIDKMFSLEAMNDLRWNTDRRFSSGATLAALKAPIRDRLGFDDSYYRRAVRKNEIFFVVPIESLYDAGTFRLLTGMDDPIDE